MKTLSRPSWDEYFLSLACLTSTRSEDLYNKHGAIIVDNKTHYIVSTGYNGFIPKFDKSLIDITDRELRRPYMKHAEDNAIKNTSVALHMFDSLSFYVTGHPCNNCLEMIIGTPNINRIIIIDRESSIHGEYYEETRRKNILATREVEWSKYKVHDYSHPVLRESIKFLTLTDDKNVYNTLSEGTNNNKGEK